MAKKNKQKQGRKKFLVGRKKTKALLPFLAMARLGDWLKKMQMCFVCGRASFLVVILSSIDCVEFIYVRIV
jgi:poly-D-alanine transfer protein DltD